jgi:hypothetical protein
MKTSVKQRHAAAGAAVAALALAFSLTSRPAFPQQLATPPATQAVDVNAVVAAWVQHSAQLKTLSAKFRRKDQRPAMGTREFVYEVRWKNSGPAVLDISQLLDQEKPEHWVRVVWTGREVWQYHTYRKEVEVRSMERVASYEAFRAMAKDSWQGRWAANQLDLIFPALGDPKDADPLPFWIGMKDVVARKQLTFELLDASNPKRFILRATPAGPGPDSPYHDILITLDRARFLPLSVVYRKGWGNNDTRQFTLVDVALDAVLDDAAFAPTQPKGWKIKYE